MKNERSIQEIINELISHPDYLHSEIILLSDFLSETNIDEDFEEITEVDITTELREKIVEKIQCTISYGYEFSSPYLMLEKKMEK
jgi:hypothetical protein